MTAITIDMTIVEVMQITAAEVGVANTPEFDAWMKAHAAELEAMEKDPELRAKYRDEAFAGQPESVATAKHRKRHGGKLE